MKSRAYESDDEATGYSVTKLGTSVPSVTSVQLVIRAQAGDWRCLSEQRHGVNGFVKRTVNQRDFDGSEAIQ